MEHYVVGFAFTQDLSEVILIKKNRPSWQVGLYNGIGGHIEPGEYCIEAMLREFKEETSVATDARDWSHVGALYFPAATLDIFTLRQTQACLAAKTNSDEHVLRARVSELPDTVSNVTQLIELCIQYLKRCDNETH